MYPFIFKSVATSLFILLPSDKFKVKVRVLLFNSKGKAVGIISLKYFQGFKSFISNLF